MSGALSLYAAAIMHHWSYPYIGSILGSVCSLVYLYFTIPHAKYSKTASTTVVGLSGLLWIAVYTSWISLLFISALVFPSLVIGALIYLAGKLAGLIE